MQRCARPLPLCHAAGALEARTAMACSSCTLHPTPYTLHRYRHVTQQLHSRHGVGECVEFARQFALAMPSVRIGVTARSPVIPAAIHLTPCTPFVATSAVCTFAVGRRRSPVPRRRPIPAIITGRRPVVVAVSIVPGRRRPPIPRWGRTVWAPVWRVLSVWWAMPVITAAMRRRRSVAGRWRPVPLIPAHTNQMLKRKDQRGSTNAGAGASWKASDTGKPARYGKTPGGGGPYPGGGGPYPPAHPGPRGQGAEHLPQALPSNGVNDF